MSSLVSIFFREHTCAGVHCWKTRLSSHFACRPNIPQCLWALCVRLPLLLEERSDLHAHRLQRVPGSLPVHPHHAIICAVLGHVLGVGSSPVVSAVGIGRVTAMVPPAAAVFFGALFHGVTRDPEHIEGKTQRSQDKKRPAPWFGEFLWSYWLMVMCYSEYMQPSAV